MYAKSKYFSIYINWGIFYLVIIQRKGDNLGNLIVGDVLLLFFSIYVGIFFKKFHTDYPKMRVGFHIWEVCYNKECWEYGNNFAGNLSIIIGIILFGIIYPIILYFKIKRNICVILLIVFTILYFILLLLILRYHMRKKFNLKDEKDDEDDKK